ncbi:MAG: branched-chain amino acid ABC transporter permease, partial [Candidatus Eisenbacteria bacterium]|nr:branched-chain amino acid ABC transporter permease [Candidatus Eisenbacteria bacterium]
MDYFLHILVIMTVYTTLAVSLDLLAGHTGLLSIAHAAFYGIGAYCSAILAVSFGLGFMLSTVCGILMAALVSFVVSFPSLRLHDDYFVIATFGFQFILFSIFNNWMGVTRGPLGIPGIPEPVIFSWKVDSHIEFLAFGSAFAALAIIVANRLSSSPFGRVLRTIREDEVLARSLGKNTLYFKVAVFAVSAALAASAGCLYAHYITYIDPTSFSMMESILVISMVIIGGAGSKWGPVIGAVVLVILPEALRFIGMPSSVAANMRQVFYGALFVIMMMFRPRGLVGKY